MIIRTKLQQSGMTNGQIEVYASDLKNVIRKLCMHLMNTNTTNRTYTCQELHCPLSAAPCHLHILMTTSELDMLSDYMQKNPEAFT